MLIASLPIESEGFAADRRLAMCLSDPDWLLSILAENSALCSTKVPPPFIGDGLQFQLARARMKPAGEA